MNILVIGKYPPIQGGVSADMFWTAQAFAELGHSVTVLTNAAEVEGKGRITLESADIALLSGFRNKGSVRVVNTYDDVKHFHTPHVNPIVSKIVTLGLKEIERAKPDIIWSFYLEPYGVAALFLSLLTGVPYLVRHAGSDLGRMFLTEQLQALYTEVFRHASFVLSTKQHWKDLTALGVSSGNLLEPTSLRLPGDLFYPTELPPLNEEIRLGIYGKTGPSKGTLELLQALVMLKEEGIPAVLEAAWGGRKLQEARELAADLKLGQSLTLIPFLPHWRIPDLIRRQHAILFLENNFSISFHGPGIPLEVSACGRPLVVTEEIMDKPRYSELFRDGENAFFVKGRPLTAQAIVEAVKRCHAWFSVGQNIPIEMCVDASLYSAHSRQKLMSQLTIIANRLGRG